MAMQESYSMTRDNLFAGTQVMPVVADKLTIAASLELKRGSLVDATGTLCGVGAEVYAVLADDVDTTEEAKEVAVYLKGEFNEKALFVAEGAMVAELKQSARKVCIFIKPCM